jgi:predicted MPP superfamily phosphohydrolase
VGGDVLRGSSIQRRAFLRVSLGACGAAALTGLYAWRVEPHWVQVVHRGLAIRGLPGNLIGKTLVQLSDFHVGPRVDDAYLIGALERVAAMRPDIVVFTGDFITYQTGGTKQKAGGMERLARVLSHFPHGRLGSAAILGNHDYGPAWSHPEIADAVADTAQNAGLVVLRNASTQIAGLQFVGMDDLWARRFSPLAAFVQSDPELPTIALTHNPDSVDRKGWELHQGWILGGHTHGGQCKPPFLPPPLLPVENKRYTAGEFALSAGRQLYINRGLGHLLRVRFNVRPEVTVFELQRA